MTDALQVAIVAAIPASITAVLSALTLYQSIRSGWQSERAADAAETSASISKENTGKIGEVHQVINSRMDQLLAARSQEAHAEGVQQEREESRARVIASKIAETNAMVMVEEAKNPKNGG